MDPTLPLRQSDVVIQVVWSQAGGQGPGKRERIRCPGQCLLGPRQWPKPRAAKSQQLTSG